MDCFTQKPQQNKYADVYFKNVKRCYTLCDNTSLMHFMTPAGNQVESSDHEVRSQDLPVKDETLLVLLEPTEALESSMEHPKQSEGIETTDEPVVDLDQSTGP